MLTTCAFNSALLRLSQLQVAPHVTGSLRVSFFWTLAASSSSSDSEALLELLEESAPFFLLFFPFFFPFFFSFSPFLGLFGALLCKLSKSVVTAGHLLGYYWVTF